ncbi:MAG: class I SAM-dependent methyltransferase [Verrucomicrobiota bacterium]
MNKETYTPGHTKNATNFMGKRTLHSHGLFFSPHLNEHFDILDLGCGPGTISVGLAETTKGRVVGIDYGKSQIEKAREHASKSGCQNLEFQIASCYELPFDDCTFDRVFSHALMEHLHDPVAALKEANRVLRPSGKIGICSPDADGWLLSPPSTKLSKAVNSYAELQASNGGDLRIGKRLGVLLKESGFSDIELSARYECYPSLEFIGEYLALQLEQEDNVNDAKTLRDWSKSAEGLFAQAWVSAVGTKVE